VSVVRVRNPSNFRDSWVAQAVLTDCMKKADRIKKTSSEQCSHDTQTFDHHGKTVDGTKNSWYDEI